MSLVLMSGPGAAGYAGPGWFLEVVRLARADHPTVAVTAILDCADRPGRALGALRLGAKVLRLSGNARARRRVAAIARAMDARLDDTRFDVLDLAGSGDARAAVSAFLTSASSFETPAARAPQDEAQDIPPHPEEGRRPVSKDDVLGLRSYETRHPEEAQSAVSKDEKRRAKFSRAKFK
ncbi:MAG: hypothetical protein IT563_04865 [Alphaproteobacteria bacterium]|nr:hypothetical protein [Alphaproteobacteria bacterium]